MQSLPQPEGGGLTDAQAAQMVATGLLAPFPYLPGPGGSLVWGHRCRSANALASADSSVLGCASAERVVTALSPDRSPVAGDPERRGRGKLFFGSGVSVSLPRGKSRPRLENESVVDRERPSRKGLAAWRSAQATVAEALPRKPQALLCPWVTSGTDCHRLGVHSAPAAAPRPRGLAAPQGGPRAATRALPPSTPSLE